MTKSVDKREARGVLKRALFLIPEFLKLLVRLFKDSRVPTTEKALLIGAIVYVISPIDALPDMIPFLGQVDDLYLISLVLLRLLARSPQDVVREHWEGGGDLVSLVEKIVRAAQYVLPRRIQYILLGRVEIAPQVKTGGMLSSPAAPSLIEIERDKIARKR